VSEVTNSQLDPVEVRVIRKLFDAVDRSPARLEAPYLPVWEYVPKDMATDQLRVIHNGSYLSEDEARGTIASPGDQILVVLIPGYGLEYGVIPAILITVSVVGASVGINYAIAAASAPSIPDTNDMSALTDSPTYGWDGVSNTVRPGTPIPIVYGTHRIGGHFIQQTLRQSREATTVGELNTLIGVCSGPVEAISSVRVNKNPIDNFTGVVLDYRMGAFNQEVIDGFETLAVTSQYDRPVLFGDSKAVEITTVSEVDGIEVLLRFPSGLFCVDGDGNFAPRQIEIQIEYREYGTLEWTNAVGGSGMVILRECRSNTFDVFREILGLPRARYDIRVTRHSADESAATGSSTVHVLAINELQQGTGATYPGVALVSVRHLPSDQVSGSTPEYDCLVKGKKVRIFTTPTAYTVQWSDNPAWCLLDLLTNKFDGLGAWIKDADVDLQSFIDWANFCDVLVAKDANGALEKRCRLNIVLDGTLTAIDAIQQLCMTGRANVMLRGTKWSIRIDQPENPVQLFTMGRIRRDSFSVSRTSRSKLSNYFTGQFWSADLEYESDSIPISDPTLLEGADQMEKGVNLIGTTSASQAARILNYLMLANRLLRRSVQFEVGTESLAMEAGDVFKLAHDVPGWGKSGMLQEVDSTGTTLLLDREVTIEAGKVYELTVIHDADTIDVVGVTSNPGTCDRIQVTGDWTSTPSRGTHYSFGEVTRSTVLYRCQSITRGSQPWLRKITAQEYNEAIYGEDLTVLPEPSPTWLIDPNRIPDDVQNLRLHERVGYAAGGTIKAAIDCFFAMPIVAMARAQVFWRPVGDFGWDPVGPPVDAGYCAIERGVVAPGGSYEISVVTLSPNGNRKHPDAGVRASITTVGTTRQPGNVVGFVASRTLEGLVFSWEPLDPSTNADLAYYELRQGSSWQTAIKLGQTLDTTFATTAYLKGTQTYLVKGVNTSGNESAIPAVVVFLVEGRIGENVIFTRTEDPTWGGIKENATVDSGTLLLDTEAGVVAWRGQQQVSPFRSTLFPGGYGASFRVTGSYTTDVFQVADEPLRALIATEIEASQIDTSLYWTAAGVADQSWISDFAKSRAWSVGPEGSVRLKVEMRFSTTGTDDSNFTAWKECAQNVEITVKYAQARVTVTVADPAYTVRLTKLRMGFDVPDIVEGGSIATSDTAAVAVTFEKAFNAEPKIALSVIGATAGDEVFATSKTKTGFNLAVRNGAGALVVRQVNFTAVGY
jgi:hypothetical protein